MASVEVIASLAALLAANRTSLLECVCKHISIVNNPSLGEGFVWSYYCNGYYDLWLYGPCNSSVTASTAAAVLDRLQQPNWWGGYGQPQAAQGDTRDAECGRAVAAVRGLAPDEVEQLTTELNCRIADDCVRSCSAPELNDTQWNVTMMATDHLRHPILSQHLRAVWHITRAIITRIQCETLHRNLRDLLSSNKHEFLKYLSGYWRDMVQLLSHGVTHLSQLVLPLSFDLMDNHRNDQQLHGWINNIQHLRDMLLTKLSGSLHDAQYASEHMQNYKIDENKTSPGKHIIRRPLLSENLLLYQERFLSFGEDFTAVCEKRQPHASQMFSLANALYSFWYETWFSTLQILGNGTDVIDEEWQLEDRSSDTLTVDTGCLQLLADALEHPTCPLEDLPLETVENRKQCRRQLWDDMVQRSPHIPVTSYLAYTQRASINLCLLAWMAVNSFSVCQDVPFSMIQSVHDARCYFDRPHDQSCLQSNATDAICVVSRAILLLKCRDFSSRKTVSVCRSTHYSIEFFEGGLNEEKGSLKAGVNPTETTLNYKHSLNSATLKYKDFKIDSLKPLEISFISINILFRFFTAAVYIYLPQCRNLPGKILLLFQITAITQILFSEIVYRNAGVPDLSTTVLIDSALTLLSCLWLNSFCYRMYACIRHLRLPNDLAPAEVSKILRRQVFYALVLCSAVSTGCTILEKKSKYYLIYSRILFIVVISLSVACNVIGLGLIGYIYMRNKRSMSRLRISSEDKPASKKEIVFVSIKTVILSGIGIIIRLGFHQAKGIAQFVYCVHIATMMQGPVLFVLFVCNDTVLPVLRRRLLACCNAEVDSPDREVCSAERRNLARKRNEPPLAVETPL